jgi:hypothetical protein
LEGLVLREKGEGGQEAKRILEEEKMISNTSLNVRFQRPMCYCPAAAVEKYNLSGLKP